jgi:hypothetical protein
MSNKFNWNKLTKVLLTQAVGLGVQEGLKRYGSSLKEAGFQMFEKKFLPKQAPDLLSMTKDELKGLLQRDDGGILIERWQRKQGRKSNNFYRGYALVQCILCDMEEDTAIELFINNTVAATLAQKALERLPILLLGNTSQQVAYFVAELRTSSSSNQILAVYEEYYELILKYKLQDNLF